MKSKRETDHKQQQQQQIVVFKHDCWPTRNSRVIPGLFEGGLAVTSVSTVATRVGFDKSLLDALSLRAGPSRPEENSPSVVAGRSCQKTREASGEPRGGQK